MIGKVRVHPHDENGRTLPHVLVDMEISHNFTVQTPKSTDKHGFIRTAQGTYALVRLMDRTNIWDIILIDPIKEDDIEAFIENTYVKWSWGISERKQPDFQNVEYNTEEWWSVLAAKEAMERREMEPNEKNISEWLQIRSGQEHAYGEFRPVANEKITAILADESQQ